MIIKFFKRTFYLIKYLSWIDPKTKIGKNCKIGPFAHIRHGVILKDNVRIGNFVEIKNSTIGENTKIMHLSYIGDTEIGKNVNIGAGTITCNYDGEKKNKTIIEDDVFIGTNNSLVAPVRIGKNAYTAAGSVITEDVPPYALAIGRARQINKLNWVKKRKAQEIKKAIIKLSTKCPKCGDELPWNTHGKFKTCSCGYLSVDGDGEIIRIITKNQSKKD